MAGMSDEAFEVHGLEPADAWELELACRTAFELGGRLEWRSHDPFDLLLSPFTRPVGAVSSLAARAVVQLGRRTGTAIRRTLRVPLHEEAKALADFLCAAVMLGQHGEGWARSYVLPLSERLLSRSVIEPTGRGWGLEFPYASRFGSFDARTPNIYTTTAACQALLAEHELTGSSASADAAYAGACFILEGLGSFEYAGRRWLRYVPRSDDPIVNVQGSSASLFARLGTRLGDERLLRAADSAAETVLASQRSDGSWTYSQDGSAQFVDGFHTGFTLEGLEGYLSSRRENAIDGADDAVRSGFRYFKEHLVTPDGLPRGFADGAPSLDGQNVAQCVQTLVVCGDTAGEVRQALRLWRLGVRGELLGDDRERSTYPALRWRLGPAVVATAHLLSMRIGRSSAGQPRDGR